MISCRRSSLTLAERHRRIPLVNPLRRPGARGAALANEAEALVAAETQGAAQLGASQAVHGAVFGVVRGAAVGRWRRGGECETKESESARRQTVWREEGETTTELIMMQMVREGAEG